MAMPPINSQCSLSTIGDRMERIPAGKYTFLLSILCAFATGCEGHDQSKSKSSTRITASHSAGESAATQPVESSASIDNMVAVSLVDDSADAKTITNQQMLALSAEISAQIRANQALNSQTMTVQMADQLSGELTKYLNAIRNADAESAAAALRAIDAATGVPSQSSAQNQFKSPQMLLMGFPFAGFALGLIRQVVNAGASLIGALAKPVVQTVAAVVSTAVQAAQNVVALPASIVASIGNLVGATVAPLAPVGNTITLFDKITFYDDSTEVGDVLPVGTVRQGNAHYARKLSAQELSSLGATMNLNLRLHAACATYDGGGFFSVALVPKGTVLNSLNDAEIKRIEVGRFITPFMNKTIQPDTVPYSFYIGNLAKSLRDSSLNNQYDIWIELEIGIGIGDAGTQVAGCAGHHDGFVGTAMIALGTSSVPDRNDYLQPIAHKSNLNNYEAAATDSIGTAVKSIPFKLEAPIHNASYYLITTKHGSNSGGEEYIRRKQYVYLDDKKIAEFTPGGNSCEPYRIYNTMKNGIYGAFPLPTWFLWSNWCPGAAVPTRQLPLGNLSAGNHTFKIAIPDAAFAGKQGTVLFSVYLLGNHQ